MTASPDSIPLDLSWDALPRTLQFSFYMWNRDGLLERMEK